MYIFILMKFNKTAFFFFFLVKRFKNVVNCIEKLLMPNYRFKGVIRFL